MFYTTGEFAAIMGVTRRTLSYYREEGLFLPERIEDNGYHYYSQAQMYPFYLIRALLELGLSLEELKTYVGNKNTKRLQEMLKEKEKELAEEIERKKRLQRALKNRAAMLSLAAKAERGEMEISHFPKAQLLLSAPLPRRDKKERARLEERHALLGMKHHLVSGYRVGIMTAVEDLQKEDYEVYARYYTYIYKGMKFPRSDDAVPGERPAGLYAVSYGKDYDYAKRYRNLFQFIEANGYRPFGYAYEDLMEDELCTDDPAEQTTRIMISIEVRAALSV